MTPMQPVTKAFAQRRHNGPGYPHAHRYNFRRWGHLVASKGRPRSPLNLSCGHPTTDRMSLRPSSAPAPVRSTPTSSDAARFPESPRPDNLGSTHWHEDPGAGNGSRSARSSIGLQTLGQSLWWRRQEPGDRATIGCARRGAPAVGPNRRGVDRRRPPRPPVVRPTPWALPAVAGAVLRADRRGPGGNPSAGAAAVGVAHPSRPRPARSCIRGRWSTSPWCPTAST